MQPTDLSGGAARWLLLKKTDQPHQVITDVSRRDEVSSRRRIRCPRCEWEPGASSQWVCWSGDGPEPAFTSCGTAWNTFATRGKCPGCAHQWRWTSCLHCYEWSLHDDWYED